MKKILLLGIIAVVLATSYLVMTHFYPNPGPIATGGSDSAIMLAAGDDTHAQPGEGDMLAGGQDGGGKYSKDECWFAVGTDTGPMKKLIISAAAKTPSDEVGLAADGQGLTKLRDELFAAVPDEEGAKALLGASSTQKPKAYFIHTGPGLQKTILFGIESGPKPPTKIFFEDKHKPVTKALFGDASHKNGKLFEESGF